MLCVFEYPSEEKEEPVVYWRRGPNCHNQQSLQSSSSVGRSQVHITKNTLRGFSILKLSNVDENASNSYFCDVTLTHKIQGKCGNGTRLTVHGKEHQEWQKWVWGVQGEWNLPSALLSSLPPLASARSRVGKNWVYSCMSRGGKACLLFELFVQPDRQTSRGQRLWV